jgi:hypothetical protein
LTGQALLTTTPAAERDEQRYERDPGDRRVAVLGEAEREQDARGDR